MQFLVYDPTFDPADFESAEPPSAEAMEEMGNFIAEAYEAGVIVATGALQTHGKRLVYEDGEFTVTDGPFIELKELVAGWAILDVDSVDEAIEWSKRFREIVGEGVSEIVQLHGPHDDGNA